MWPLSRFDFEGTREAVKYALRDLDTLEAAMKFCGQHRSVIQGGGSLGVFPKYLARTFRAVYTFEPDPEIFLKLCRNVPEPNVIKLQAAMGVERNKIKTLTARRDGKTNIHEGITHIIKDEPGIIPTLQIDDLNVIGCDLLVLDLEGWEPWALIGAEETIGRCRPVIMIEINKSLGFYKDFTQEGVRGMLVMRGYKFHSRLHSDEIWLPKERSK